MSTLYPASRILVLDSSPSELADMARAIKRETAAHVDYTVAGVAAMPAHLAESHYDLVVRDGGTSQDNDALTQQLLGGPWSGRVLVLLAEPTVAQTVELMRAGSCGVAKKSDSQQVLSLIDELLATGVTRQPDAIYQQIVENQTELICRFDAAGRLLFVNQAYCDWQNASAGELLGTIFLDNIPEADRERVNAKIRQLNREQPGAVSLQTTIRPDGSRQIIEWTDSAIFDSAGNLVEFQGIGRDVTEREQQAVRLAEINSELATSRTHFAAVLDTMQDALTSVSLPDNQLIFVSAAFEAVYGYPYARFGEDPEFFKQVVHPDDLNLALSASQTCLAEGFAELDHRIIWPDGQTRWVHRRAWVNYDEHGRPIRVNDSARDITERMENQQALQERETNLQTLFDTIDDFLFILAEDGNIVEVNETVVARLGYEREALLGQPVLIVHPPARHEEAAAIVTQILAGNSRTCFIPLQTCEGTLIAVETTVTRGIWNGQPALFGLSKDITELQLSEQKFALAFQTNPAIAGLRSLETGEFLEVNDTFCDKLGYTRAEVLGVKSSSLRILDRAWRSAGMETLQARGFIRNEETRLFAKDGTPIPVLISAQVITLQGQAYLYTTAVDITERKRAENELRAREEQLKSLIDSQTNYLARMDLEGHYTYWNSKFAQDFGWVHGNNTVANGPVLDSTAPHHRQRVVEIIRQCVAKPGVPVQVELDKLDKHGGIRPTLWEFIALTNGNGSATQLQSIGIDISDLVTARETVQLQANLLEQVSDAIITFDNERKITSWNRAAQTIYGWTEREASGQVLEELVQAEWLTDGLAIAEERFRQTGQWQGELRERDKSGGIHYIIASVNRLYSEYGEPIGGVIINRDITAEKKQRILAGRIRQVLEEIARREALPAILDYLTRAIEEFNPDIKASILLLDRDNQALRHGSAPSLPAAYIAAIDGSVIGPNTGSCGTAAYEKRTVIVDDIATDPLWRDYKELAAAYDLRACWSQPVLNQNGEVLATFATYYHTIRQPSQLEIELIQLASHIAGLAIEHAQAEKDLKRNERRYRQMFQLMNLPKLLIDASSARILDANPAAVTFYGYSLETLKSMTMMEINVAAESTIRERIQKLLAKEISSCLFEQRLADGTIRDVEVFATEIEHDDGRVLYSAFVDVTERNLFQTALQEANQALEERVNARTRALEISRDRLEAIFNHSGDGILLVDKELKIQQSNFAAGEMLGITAPTSINEFLARHDEVELQAIVKDIVTNHVTRRIETQGTRQDGRCFDVEISLAPVNRSDRAVENIVCIVRDISERKRSEAERQQHLALIEDLYNNAPTGYHSTDADNVIVQINDTELKWLGYTREEVVGQHSPADFLTPASLQVWAEHLPLLHEQGELSGLELELVRKDGSTFWIAGSASVIRDEDGKFLRTRTAVIDITALKQAQKAIAEERNLLRTVIDTVPDFIYVKDTRHRMILNNIAHTRSVGAATPADLLGKTDSELFPAALASKFHEDELGLLANETPIINVEERSLGIDGSEIWALTTKVPLKNIQGDLVGLVGITRDVTELKQKEEALLQSEQQLRESENMLQLVLDTIPVRVFWKDLNLNYLGCNRLFADDAGLANTNDIVGRNDLDMPWAREQATDYRADDKVVIETGIPKLNYEEPQLNSEGKWITLLTSKIPLRDVNDQIVGMLGTYIDVTERKDAEEQLRYLASLQEFISDSVVSLDLSLNIQSWNNAAETMFGWQANEAIGRTLHELIKIDIPGQDFAGAMQELSKTGCWYGESLIYHRDGTPKNLSSSISFTRDEAGNPTGFITVHHDITERVRTERALKESEAQYRMLAENVKDVIVKVDVDGTVRYATPSASTMLGYEPEEIIGVDGFSIVHPEDVERVRHILQSTVEAGENSFHLEERLRHKDGHYIWVDAASNIIYDPVTRAPRDTVGVLRDITGRKATELALRASEEKFRLFIESAPIATIISDMHGRITLLNRAAEQLLGYQNAEFVGQPARLLVPDHREELQQLLLRDEAFAEQRQPTAALELYLRKKDGQIFPADVQLSRVQVEPEPLVMAFVIDISERKMAESTLKQALEKEKELGELKSRFVSMASHQFRTPLTAILASAETLTYYRDRMDQAQIDTRLERIRNQVFFMKTIMEDVLELARIQANQVRYQPVEGDLDALCQEIIEDFEHQEAYTGRIRYQANPIPFTAKFDPHLMHHLLSNLFHNALKYSARETTVDVSLSQNNDEICFIVKDLGIGISSEDQKHLFEPFFRAINVGTISGTGLGLSIVKQAVEAHGGTIQFESEVDRGTTFFVNIPMIL